MVNSHEIKGWIGEKNLISDAEVAVVLVSFNRPKMVTRCIESVLNQTFDYFNLYVMDNNSLPEVKEVLLKYQHCPRVAIYFSNTQAHERLDKYWFGVMANIGVQKGNESCLVFLADDVYMLPDSLQVKVDYLRQNPNVMLCFGAQYMIRKDGSLLGIRNFFPVNYKIVKGSCVVDFCQTMLRRKLLKETGPLNEDADAKPYPWADAILFDKAQALGYALYSVGKRTDVFIKHEKSQMAYLLQGRKNELLTNQIWE